MNKEWQETVKEIEDMRTAIAKKTDIYTANAIDRLIMARLKLERINHKEPIGDTK
jgi:hypothetical protein